LLWSRFPISGGIILLHIIKGTLSMSLNENFNKKSYAFHENHFNAYARGGAKEKQAKKWLENDTVDARRHNRMNKTIDSLLKAYSNAKWLTIGDGRFGNDAHYIQGKGLPVLSPQHILAY